MKKSRGSAIIIAIFLIAAVGSVAFGIARLFALESNIAGIYENSTVAYYAAESGIEEGLLRYRYDKNTQMPTGGSPPVFDETKMSYGDLTTLKQSSSSVPNANQYIYGMQMSYLGNYYGADLYGDGQRLNDTSLRDAAYTKKEFMISRDNSIKLDVTNLAEIGGVQGGDLVLYVRPAGTTGACSTDNAYLEAKVTGKTSRKLEEEKVVLSYKNIVPDKNYLQATVLPGLPVIYKYDNLLANIRNSTEGYSKFESGSIELFLKPISCDVYIGIQPAVNGDKIVQPYSKIKSTGYYGGVTRTLEASIDRQAGTLYDLFDFVLYSRN